MRSLIFAIAVCIAAQASAQEWRGFPGSTLRMSAPAAAAPLTPGPQLSRAPVSGFFVPSHQSAYNDRGQSVLFDASGSPVEVHSGQPKVRHIDPYGRLFIIDNGRVKLLRNVTVESSLRAMDAYGRRTKLTVPFAVFGR